MKNAVTSSFKAECKIPSSQKVRVEAARVVISEKWDWGFRLLKRQPGKKMYTKQGHQTEKRKIRAPIKSQGLSTNHSKGRGFWNSGTTEISKTSFKYTKSHAQGQRNVQEDGLGKWREDNTGTQLWEKHVRLESGYRIHPSVDSAILGLREQNQEPVSLSSGSKPNLLCDSLNTKLQNLPKKGKNR